MKKNIKIIPDEVYNLGPFTVARFGKLVQFSSNLSEEQRKQATERAALEYGPIKVQISKLVNDIKELIGKIHPLELLHRNYFNFLFSNNGIKSEADLDENQIVALRMLDYAQSIITTIPLKDAYEEFTDENFNLLISKIKEMYEILNLPFILCRSSYEQLNNSSYDFEFDKIYTQAQILWVNVRGNKYLHHNIDFIRELFLPHTDILNKLFNITADEFIAGLDKIQFTLTKGIDKARSELAVIQEIMVSKAVEKELDTSDPEIFKDIFESDLASDQRELFKDAHGKLFGLDLFDIGKVTGWPDNLLRELSWEPGENNDFFAEGDYCGWPLRIEPIKLRPFLWIKGKAYCFEPTSLMDNIYRVMQKIICKLESSYREEWNKKQKELSEELPIKVLTDLLPNASYYKSINFRWFSSKESTTKDWQETDGLIIFDDHLIIIEVKAGAFTYTSPANDFPSYINSIKNLLLNPAKQCNKFIQYLNSQDEVELFNSSHISIGKLSKKQFRHITACCVTLDSFTTLAAKAKSLSAIGVELNEHPVWPVSIADLVVYRDIFTSPYVFLHFLEKRQLAFSAPALELDDELDHLGLYLTHNDYIAVAQDFPESLPISWNGYRKNIDEYFTNLYLEPSQAVKPAQNMPYIYQEIIRIISHKPGNKYSKAISTLLDQGGDARNEFEIGVNNVLEKQKLNKRPIPFNQLGNAAIVTFIKQEDFTYPDTTWIMDYIYRTILGAQYEEALGVILEYNGSEKLVDVELITVKKSDIPRHKIPELQTQLEGRYESLKRSYLRETGKDKIGRNDICPCGSGKKYKKCHGK